MDWHSQTAQEIARQLEIDINWGLSHQEVLKRRKKHGLNQLAAEKPISPFRIFLRQFNSLVIWVLLIATLISFFLGEWLNASAILMIVFLNSVIGFVLEYRADRAMSALKKLTAPKAKVLREGKQVIILAPEIVPGDILYVESGDVIAADGRLFNLSALKTNEAPLTGESLPVDKNIEIYPIKTLISDQKNKIFMGTSIVYGTGKAIVVATGMKTEMGRIADLLQTASSEQTPLQTKLNQVASRLLWSSFLIVVIIFILGLWRNIPLFTLLMSAVGLAVAAIPEGLPAMVTIALALGVQRMSRRRVLVRHMAAVETMGCLQVICADKTGTLTLGENTARKLMIDKNVYTIFGEGYNLLGDFVCGDTKINPLEDKNLQLMLWAAAACNNAEISEEKKSVKVTGDPTEIALLIVARKAGITLPQINAAMPRVQELPFSSERKRMTIIRHDKEKFVAFVKGAPEVILGRCTTLLSHDGIRVMTTEDQASMRQACIWMASEGLRVLAIAKKETTLIKDKDFSESIETNLVLLGLIGMQDPPHPETKGAIKQCQQAGIKPVMMTGDHPATAQAIAEELGIFLPGDKILTGYDLDSLSAGQLSDHIKQVAVYARVLPEHKLKIIRGFKNHGMIVGMTGDGINDAPALKEAAVGIAMGRTGTDVTKEAADIIITDNNFSSIVAAIEEGRTIYNNIVKSLAYLLAGNAGELIVMFVALLVGWPLPLLPIQLLWINLITDGLPALALATDTSSPDILSKPPREPNQSIMNKQFFKHILLVGTLTATVTLSAFAYYIATHDLIQARDAAFSILVTAELLRAFGARSWKKNIWQINIFSNLRLFLIISISFSLQIMIHHVPLLQNIFGIGAVSWKECISWVLLGIIPLAVLELAKLLRKT